MRRMSWAVVAVLLAGAAQAEVKPNSLFTDHAVLQQGMPIPVWGTADDGETVSVRFRGQEVSTTAKDGRWMVRLGPVGAGGPFELVIAGPNNTVTLADVMCGEVWVCSGQSNMQWNVANSADAERHIAEATDNALRLFSVPLAHSDEEIEDCHSKWVVCSPDAVKGFTAVGYFFGQHLRRALSVPVGLINSSWGGTPAEAWTSWRTLNLVPELQVFYTKYIAACAAWPENWAKYQQALAEWRQKAEEAKQKGEPVPRQPGVPYGPTHHHRPGALFRAMIRPLVPYAIKGAIWYQGESNAGRAYQYRTLMPAMIQDWRDAWGEGDFTFLMVQLAPFMKIKTEPAESAWAELREAQLMTTRALPNVGMAVITEYGEENDIHPRRKQPVGERLGLAARGIAYHQRITWSGPIYRSVLVKPGHLRLFFDHVDGGLRSHDGPLTGFVIAGEDRVWHNAQARISGDQVVVWSPDVPEPVAARFGWADYPVVNLYNRAGLPASPFRTDSWPGITANNR